MLLVPFFCFVTALGFAGFGVAMAATVAKIDQFNYVTALFVTPLFLVAGTFFPIDGLPEGVQVVAQVNPLHQLVELVRGGAFGFEAVDLARFAFLVAFALLTWRIAISRMQHAPDRLSRAELHRPPDRNGEEMDRAPAFETRSPGVSVAFGSSRARLRHPRHPLKAASFRT